MRRGISPTDPFRTLLSLALLALGLSGMVLGAHGVYVYFNRLETVLGGGSGKLFLLIDVPMRLRDLVVWASARGLQSWFIPVLVFFAGLWISNYSKGWLLLTRFLHRYGP